MKTDCVMKTHHCMIKCEENYIQNLHSHDAVEVKQVLSLFSQCSTITFNGVSQFRR